MGVFTVKVTVWNPRKPEIKIDLELLVDSGAIYTILPANFLKSLEIEPIRSIKLRLADNRVIKKPLGEIGIEIEGYKASATPVVFGGEGIYLLGSVTMEQLGLMPDPVHKKLKPTEALLMQVS
jgi:predicted aspartyl protease